MQHKLMALLTALVLFSFVVTPVSMAQAQGNIQDVIPSCPPFDSSLMKDKDFLHSLPVECIRAFKTFNTEGDPFRQIQNAEPTVSEPDSFGYTFDVVTYNWIAATTSSGLTGDDEFTGPIDIGFSFPFYGTPQTQLYFNTNGLITFGTGSGEWGKHGIPNDVNPNNLIAAFWDDLFVGAPYGAIYYSRGGNAPNRYFVVEWRSLENYTGSGTATFEAILYENGDIVIQIGNFPTPYFAAVGIEDSTGHQGLQYQALNCCFMSVTAIRFYYPTTPAARLLAYSPQASGFAQLGGHKDFPIVVKNNGTLGADTFDLSAPVSLWPGTYYAADGVTPLSDTDGDHLIDTGPIASGASTTIIASYLVPAGAAVGTGTGDYITVSSSLNNSVKSYVQLVMEVPSQFANVFVDNSDGAMSFLTVSADKIDLHKATIDHYFGSDVAVERLPDRRYVYAWAKGFSAGGTWTGNIEYALVSRGGEPVGAPFKLTENTGAVLDDSPSVAIAPNGTIGVVWRRYIYDNSTGKYNYNLYFATLNAAGSRLTGPTNITNNGSWGGPGIYNIPQFYNPSITASSDNHFILGWEEYRLTGPSTWKNNIWYAGRNTDGTLLVAPTALTNDNRSMEPVLNSLAGGKVILTWRGDFSGPYYAVINSNGSVFKPATALHGDLAYTSPDSVQLPNGKTVIAWTTDYAVQYSVLNSSYEAGWPYKALGTVYNGGRNLSVTTDASSRVIMTWIYGSNKQMYALLSADGGSFTDPIVYNTSPDPIEVSWNGQGNVPFEPVNSIQGNTGVGWATLSYTDGAAQSVLSDGAGNYFIDVPIHWSGTVIPSHPCYTFSPASRSYSDVTGNQLAQNYLPTVTNAPVCAVTTGVFRPSNGLLYLKNSNTTGFADVALNYGLPGDYPVVGDWDGNGTVTIGIYRGNTFYLRNENTIGFATIVFDFGQVGDQPIAGDWNGDGTDTIGVYRPSNGLFLLRNSNSAGAADMSFYLGNVGDVGIAGDWDGDGVDTTGVFRPINGIIFLKNTNETGFADYALNYGLPGDKPVMGDWNNDGIDTIGIYRNGSFYLRNSNTIGFAEIIFGLGNPGDMPIAGNWDALP